MKSLVVFYSRTGTTKKVAKLISQLLKCDIEEIIDLKNRKGALGYLMSGREATLKKFAKIKAIQKKPSSYNIVIIGTPIWAFTMSSPVRTYISQNKNSFKNVAFFCTMGGIGGKNTFKDMQKLCMKKPVALIEITTMEVMNKKYIDKIKKFVEQLKKLNRQT